VKEYGATFIDDKNDSAPAKVRMVKSVLNPMRSLFQTVLQYSDDYAGVQYESIDRSTQTEACSRCREHTSAKRADSDLGVTA
jgi:hypothetical protein